MLKLENVKWWRCHRVNDQLPRARLTVDSPVYILESTRRGGRLVQFCPTLSNMSKYKDKDKDEWWWWWYFLFQLSRYFAKIYFVKIHFGNQNLKAVDHRFQKIFDIPWSENSENLSVTNRTTYLRTGVGAFFGGIYEIRDYTNHGGNILETLWITWLCQSRRQFFDMTNFWNKKTSGFNVLENLAWGSDMELEIGSKGYNFPM